MAPTAWSHEVRFEHRAEVDRSYQIWTELPPRYDADAEVGYPLIICLDALWTFGTAVDACRILGLGRELPRAIVVGVAHDSADLREVLELRAMDFTVTASDAPAMTGVRSPGHLLGGADAFRRWLVDHVVADLRERWHVSDVTLVGHSFSALFGLNVLFNEPDAFDRYLLASPSVWWDDRVMFRLEEEHAAATDDIATRVFMSKGSLETDEFSPHKEFHDQLASRRYPGLDMTWHFFEGETHSSVVGVALNRGLRSLFAE